MTPTELAQLYVRDDESDLPSKGSPDIVTLARALLDLQATVARLTAALVGAIPWIEQHDGIAEPDGGDEDSYFGSPMETAALRARDALAGGTQALDEHDAKVRAEERVKCLDECCAVVTENAKLHRSTGNQNYLFMASGAQECVDVINNRHTFGSIKIRKGDGR